MERLGTSPQTEAPRPVPGSGPTVSVVIPVYGAFDIRRALLAIESVRRQHGVTLDIVVAERGPSSRLAKHLASDCSHVFECHDGNEHGSAYSPGRVRNDGLLSTKGDLIYLTDADVVFQSETFLWDCIALLDRHTDVILRRPRMRRLLEPYVGPFLNMANSEGLALALTALNRSQDYIATLDGSVHPLRIFSKVSDTDNYTKTFTASEDTLASLPHDRYDDIWPQVWSEDLHCGGIFCRREHLRRVAGYCEEFLSWGCEDSDLQWKLAEAFRVRFVPYTKCFEVLHLDHRKDYFSKQAWDANEAICRARRKLGLAECIERDRGQLLARLNSKRSSWLLT